MGSNPIGGAAIVAGVEGRALFMAVWRGVAAASNTNLTAHEVSPS